MMKGYRWACTCIVVSFPTLYVSYLCSVIMADFNSL